jgi:hypothetical protein
MLTVSEPELNYKPSGFPAGPSCACFVRLHNSCSAGQHGSNDSALSWIARNRSCDNATRNTRTNRSGCCFVGSWNFSRDSQLTLSLCFEISNEQSLGIELSLWSCDKYPCALNLRWSESPHFYSRMRIWLDILISCNNHAIDRLFLAKYVPLEVINIPRILGLWTLSNVWNFQ